MEMFSHKIAWDREPTDLPEGWTQCTGTLNEQHVNVHYSGINQGMVLRFTKGLTFEQTILPLKATTLKEACSEAQQIVLEASCNEGKVWISVTTDLPEAGDYQCKIINGGNEFEAVRQLIRRDSAHAWFGGVRPFADDDVVTHYQLRIWE